MSDADVSNDPRQHYPATHRNRDPILAVLREVVPSYAKVLEIASGSGEHALYFARALPTVRWQPSDSDPSLCASIAAWRERPDVGAPPINLLPPLALDVMDEAWPVAHADVIFCANMIHIAPWEATLALFAGAGRVLALGGRLILYGPFAIDGTPTAPSNEAFDASLRARDGRWGVRDLGEVSAVAARAGFAEAARHAMPANNLIVIFAR